MAALPGAAAEAIQLAWRPFRLVLPRPLQTARGSLSVKRGWLLRLTAAAGAVGWGEAAPLAWGEAWAPALGPLEDAIGAVGHLSDRGALEQGLASGCWPPALAFAIGSALAEADGLVGGAGPGWLPAPAGAWLLPAGAAALPALERHRADGAGPGSAFKWKVAVLADAEERALLERLLERLPAGARLRLDANGRWDRATALAWADRLAGEPRLQWLEQPLDPADQAGLEALAARLPVALDESLDADPPLRQDWPSWQVRRPTQEGDPRPLLAALRAGQPHLVLSTAFETGIARRWLHLLAALQAAGPTPAAPGLALAWQPDGPLVSADPRQVWEAAA